MANNNSTNNWRHFINFLAYVAVIMIGLALALSFVLGKLGVSSSVCGSLITIANALAYIIVSISAFYYSRSKRNFWVFILWLVATILIIVFMIL